MQLARNLIGGVAAICLVAGCSASSKTFYATPAKINDTQLCRTFLEAAQNGQERFARDVAQEAVRRGLTLEQCQSKVATENGVLIATALVGTAIGVGLACSNGCSGVGYSAPSYRGADWDCAGGPGDGPNYVQGPVQVPWNDPYDLDRDGDGIGCEIGDFGA